MLGGFVGGVAEVVFQETLKSWRLPILRSQKCVGGLGFRCSSLKQPTLNP